MDVVDNVVQMARKDEGVLVRLSLAEKRAFQEAAKLDDRPVSSWLRQLGRNKLRELGIAIEESKPPRKRSPA
jgi:hypothetical protein